MLNAFAAITAENTLAAVNNFFTLILPLQKAHETDRTPFFHNMHAKP
jgi:hypothetical protein